MKTDHHRSLQASTLDDLTEIQVNVEDPPLENFSADHAVDLWWADCAQRSNQGPRKEYKPLDKSSEVRDNQEHKSKDAENFTLDDWDK